ncbi:hypothetical protein BDY19DRAFT_962165, partial [Irpex rosettiformis]
NPHMPNSPLPGIGFFSLLLLRIIPSSLVPSCMQTFNLRVKKIAIFFVGVRTPPIPHLPHPTYLRVRSFTLQPTRVRSFTLQPTRVRSFTLQHNSRSHSIINLYEFSIFFITTKL